MRRRAELKCIGSGVLHSFLSRNNDLEGYWALGKLFLYAKYAGETSVSLDLFNGHVSSTLQRSCSLYQATNFDVLTTRYGGMLLRLLSKRGVPLEWLAKAVIKIDFERADIVPGYLPPGIHASPLVCSLLLTDDLSHSHVLSITGWCWPHNPAMELRSTRTGLC